MVLSVLKGLKLAGSASSIFIPFLFVALLSACGGESDSGSSDSDGDGVANELDIFPDDARESEDSDGDGDGVGNNGDVSRWTPVNSKIPMGMVSVIMQMPFLMITLKHWIPTMTA